MKTLTAPLLLAALACSAPPEPPRPQLTATATGVLMSPDAPQWKYVELEVAAPGAPLPRRPSPGRVDFDEKRSANVGSPLAGRVESVEVRLGDAVRRGDRLFSVRSGAFAELEREIDAARADLAVKQRVVQRAKDLFQLAATPEKEVLAAEAELKTAELQLRAAVAKKQSLKVGGAGENLFWVTAPRAGTIVDVDVFANQGVAPERDRALLRINDLDEVIVIADVPEREVIGLKVGTPIRVSARGGAVMRESRVESVSPVVDPRRHTVEVRVRLSNLDRELRPNAFVEVFPVPLEGELRLKVPEAAVVTDGDRSVVFVERERGRLEPSPVQVGQRHGGEVELHSGLLPGERYVARGALLLLNQVELTH